MLPLIWIPEARSGLQHIVDFVSERNPDAAGRLQDVIEHAVGLLPLNPYLYRADRVPGTREMVVLYSVHVKTRKSACESTLTSAAFQGCEVFGFSRGRSIPNYIVVYQVAAESIRVLLVLHASQQYP